MKTKRKILSLLTIVCMGFAFSSCEKEEEVMPVDETEVQTKITEKKNKDNGNKIWLGSWTEIPGFIPYCMPGHVCFILIVADAPTSNLSGGVDAHDGRVEKHYGDGTIETVEFNNFSYQLDNESNSEALGYIYMD